MSSFQLTPGDRYDARCAEIYITEKQFLVYHCSVCEEIYATFNQLLSHLTNEHYENVNEYNNEETLSVEIEILNDEEVEKVVVAKENDNTLNTEWYDQFDDKYSVLTNNSDELLDVEVEDNKEAINIEQNMDKHFQIVSLDSPLAETTVLQPKLKEKEDQQCALDTSKTLADRKKMRIVTGMLKSNIINRTKLKPLTRYQPNSMQTTNNNGDRKYVCGICGFAFKQRCNLRSHLLRHSNKKDHSCSLCTKKFFTKMELRVHEYRHKDMRPYLCNHCGMGFVCSSSLTQHTKKHHSSHRPFKCDECDKSYTNAYLLKNHMVTHSDERLFACTECTASFKLKKFLTKHLTMHINKRKLRCEYCDIGFATESALKTHRRNKHGHDDDYEHSLEPGNDQASDEDLEFLNEKQVENCEQHFEYDNNFD